MDEAKKYAPGSVKTFACPSCGGSIAIRAVGISITAVCQSCGSVIDVANDELSIISKAHTNTKVDLYLLLGSRGKLFGAEWEVIGYTERADMDESYSWSEYLLFNPWQGFRFLVEGDGHWTFVKMLRDDIDYPEYEGKKYKIFSRDKVKVIYVMGEFYWRTKVGEVSNVEDFIAPPYILSREESGQDVIWSQGEYIRQQDIRKAFGIKEEWPPPTGIAPNQPNPAGESLSAASTVSMIAIVGLIALQMLTAGLASKKILLDTTMQALSSQKGTVQTSEEFEIPDRTGNLEIMVAAPVDNSWLEVDAELVNQTTQEKDEAIIPVEYYHGYDPYDGAWSEGNQAKSDILSAVPGGKYRVLLSTDSGSPQINYRLKITRNVPVWSNFLTAFLLLIACPLALFFYHRSFETRRWAECSITLPGSSINARRFQE